MKLKVASTNRLEHLRAKDTLNGQKARHERSGLCNLRRSAGVGCDRCRWFTRTISDAVEQLDFSSLLLPQTYALRVMGDSMIEDFITEGCNYATSTRTGSTEKWHHRCGKSRRTRRTLRFYRRGDRVTLKPANSNTSRLKLPLCSAGAGCLIGVWRDYDKLSLSAS